MIQYVYVSVRHMCEHERRGIFVNQPIHTYVDALMHVLKFDSTLRQQKMLCMTYIQHTSYTYNVDINNKKGESYSVYRESIAK